MRSSSHGPTATITSPRTATAPSRSIVPAPSIVTTSPPRTTTSAASTARASCTIVRGCHTMSNIGPDAAHPDGAVNAGDGVLCSNPALRDAWYAVARRVEVGDRPVAVTLLATSVVLFRAVGGDVVAAPDRCPHREAPLSIGTIADGCLVCA